MGFWIFMVVMILLIPVSMIVLGRRLQKNPPENINLLYGYRTTRSLKNQDTWIFANRFIGAVWSIFGSALLPATILPMFFVIGKDVRTVGLFGLAMVGIQFIPMITSVFLTEHALKKTFDDDGNRRFPVKENPEDH